MLGHKADYNPEVEAGTDIVVDKVGYKVEDKVGHTQEVGDHTPAEGDNHQLPVALPGLSETFLEPVVVASGQTSHLACPSRLCAGSVQNKKLIIFHVRKDF
jgi:hypothetical protein